MIKKVLRSFLVISMLLIIFGCSKRESFVSNYLENKECTYKLHGLNDTLVLDYYLHFDTSEYYLTNYDSNRKSIYNSSYFAWHAQLISYNILNKNTDYKSIKLIWNSDSCLSKKLYVFEYNQHSLDKVFRDSTHFVFTSYLIDSIPIDHYFILNEILYELYTYYNDSRLTWNFAYLISQFEQFQCENEDEHVSFEILTLMYLAIEQSDFQNELQKELLAYISFYLNYCKPILTSDNGSINILRLNSN